MAITRLKKIQIIKNFEKIITKYNSLLIFSYKGCNVKQINTLKEKLKNSEGKMIITKNTLIKKVLTDNNISSEDKFLNSFKGQTAMAFSNDGIALANTIIEAQKNFKNIEIKSAVIDKTVIYQDKIKYLAQYKSSNGVKAQLLNLIMSPAQSIYNLVNAKINQQNEV